MTEMKLKLREEGSDENMGEINVLITMTPLTASDKDEVKFANSEIYFKKSDKEVQIN